MKNSPSSSLPDMIVLCGGKGTRLGVRTSSTPKPLLLVGGKPFLLRLLLQWHREGVRRFILATHYLADQFQEIVAEHAHLFGRIDVVVEPEPLGTGGGLKNAASFVETPTFFAANGDSYVSQALVEVIAAHRQNSSSFTLVAIAPNRVIGGAHQKGCLLMGPKGDLIRFVTEEKVTEGLVNAGLYAITRSEMDYWPSGRFDLEKVIFPKPSCYPVRVFRSNGELLDMGTPQCYSLFDQELGSLDLLFSRIHHLPNHA